MNNQSRPNVLVGHWIDGKVAGVDSSDATPIYNPATGVSTKSVMAGTEDDVDAAVRSAAQAFAAWSQTSLSARTRILFAFRELVNHNIDALARIITDEHGKVLADAAGEVRRGLEVIEYACGIAEHLKGSHSDQASTGIDVFSFREPLGVVAGITPFNFPVMVPLWMNPIAIACGNTFVLKPSERDPSASMLLAELWQKAGLPDGVFNVVQGGKDAVDAILKHPDVAAVSFVGSTPIARYIHEVGTRSGKRVQALGGAKNHAVILGDADLEDVTNHLVEAAYGSAGERCMSLSVAVAVGDVADPLVNLLKRKAEEIRVGPGTDVSSDMGPVITAEAKERISSLIGTATEQNASLVVDGRSFVLDGHSDGFFLGPTLIDDVDPTADVYREEIFGPVLAVIRVGTLDEAIQLINDNDYGNGTAIFTGSGDAARKFQRGVRVGMIGVNVPIPVPLAHYSFGGWKDSLFGEHKIYGKEGVSFYTQEKTITQRWRPPMTSGPEYSFPSSS